MTTIKVTQPPVEATRPRLYSEIEKKGVYQVFLTRGNKCPELLGFIDNKPFLFLGGDVLSTEDSILENYRYLPAKDTEVTITINNK